MVVDDSEERLRAAAFAFLDTIGARVGTITTGQLNSFVFEGKRISLLQHMRGIRVVSGYDSALTIRTTYAARLEDRPYEDEDGPDGYRRYKWQGANSNAYDNEALRHAMNSNTPLAYFLGIAPGHFLSFYPVWVVGEEPDQRQFVVALDEMMRDQSLDVVQPHPADIALRRQYALQMVKVRLHQRAFRERVLLAYGSQCALCRLRHAELLDGAHIKEDSDGGEPVVTNGVAMCAIHHRAFDAQVLGIRPDYVALQGLHHEPLLVPRRRASQPDRVLLEERFEQFRLAG